MSLLDWAGVVVMVPFLLLMVTLIVYLTIGLLRSGARRRKIANRPSPSEQATEPRPGRATRQAQGD